MVQGLGIRAVARVFEVDPNTVLQWLVEAAEQLQAFSQYFLHDVRVTQVQLDELFALLSAVKDGEVSEAEAITRLSRSPHWVWAAIDPVTKLLLTIDVGDRTLAMAQRVVHQVVQVLAPGCVAAVSHRWLQGVYDGLADPLWAVGPACLAARPQGPAPKPRWMPLPQLLYAQVVKTVRRRRLVRRAAPRGVRHPGGRRAGARAVRLADQHRLRGAPQPHHPAACRRGRAPGQHAVQGRGRRYVSSWLVSRVR